MNPITARPEGFKHVRQGFCPDHHLGPDARDPECAACAFLDGWLTRRDQETAARVLRETVEELADTKNWNKTFWDAVSWLRKRATRLEESL